MDVGRSEGDLGADVGTGGAGSAAAGSKAPCLGRRPMLERIPPAVSEAPHRTQWRPASGVSRWHDGQRTDVTSRSGRRQPVCSPDLAYLWRAMSTQLRT